MPPAPGRVGNVFLPTLVHSCVHSSAFLYAFLCAFTLCVREMCAHIVRCTHAWPWPTTPGGIGMRSRCAYVMHLMPIP